MKMLKLSKKSVLATILVLMLALSLVTVPAIASSLTSSVNSENTVEFTPGGTDGSNGYVLLAVPTFSFGEIPIASGTITKEDTSENYLKYEDLSGSLAAWKITAKLTQFKNEAGAQSLIGASITLKFTQNDMTQRNEADSVLNTTPAIPKPSVGLAAALKLASGASAESIVVSTPTVSAPAQKAGAGRWWIKMTGILTVEGPRVSKGQHSAQIDWTFNQSP